LGPESGAGGHPYLRSIALVVVLRTVSPMTDLSILDRYLTVPELVERWPIGETKIRALLRTPDFPSAFAPLRDKHGRPRSMGFLLSDVVAYEDAHKVRLSDLDVPSA